MLLRARELQRVVRFLSETLRYEKKKPINCRFQIFTKILIVSQNTERGGGNTKCGPVRTVVTIIQDLGRSSHTLLVQFHPRSRPRCAPAAQPLLDTLRTLIETCVVTYSGYFLAKYLCDLTAMSHKRIIFPTIPRDPWRRKLLRDFSEFYLNLLDPLQESLTSLRKSQTTQKNSKHC